MLIPVLFLVVMIVWLLASLPIPDAVRFEFVETWFPFLAVLLLGLYEFIPNTRW